MIKWMESGGDGRDGKGEKGGDGMDGKGVMEWMGRRGWNGCDGVVMEWMGKVCNLVDWMGW